jgi:hypothetical protein
MKNPRDLTSAELLVSLADWWRRDRKSEAVRRNMEPPMVALLDEVVRRDRTCTCLNKTGQHPISCPARESS